MSESASQSPAGLGRALCSIPPRLLLVSVLLHAAVGWRLVPALLLQWPLVGSALALAMAVSAVAVPLALAGLRRQASRARTAIAWGGMLAMGWFSSLFVLTLLREVVLIGTAVWQWATPHGLPFGHGAGAGLKSSAAGMAGPLTPFIGSVPVNALSALVVVLASVLATMLGLWNARRTAAVRHVDVPIAGLPEALHGFTIVQISDLHVGPTIRAGYVRAVVARANAQRADMVALTGDLVDGSVHDLAPHVAPLADLRSRHGSYFVTGNHEYYSGAAAWVGEMRRLGMQVLMNRHAVLEHDGASLVVAGVTDHGAHHFDAGQRSDAAASLIGAPVDAACRLLLAHQPRSADAAATAGFDVQLSGHTHGGQFWPWNLFVRFQQPFTAGLHRWGRMWVYTSRGTGYWGPPVRFGAPSEITRLRLVRT